MCAVFDLNENVHASEAAYSLSREIQFASGFTKNACSCMIPKLAICYIMLLSFVLCLCGKYHVWTVWICVASATYAQM